VAAWLLLAPGLATAHDIPASVVVQALLRPQSSHARLLVRVPLGAMRDVEFPLKDGGVLDIARADESLRDAALRWLARDIEVYEGDVKLPPPRLAAVRVSLPSDRSFATYDGALADVARNPRFATVMGLLTEAHSQRLRGRKVAAQVGSFKQTLKRMKEWWHEEDVNKPPRLVSFLFEK